MIQSRIYVKLSKTFLLQLMGSENNLRVSTPAQFYSVISLDRLPEYIENHRNLPPDFLNKISIIPPDDENRRMYHQFFHQMSQNKNFDPSCLPFESKEVQRCVASLLGLGICDALGASTEFLHYNREGHSIIKDGFADVVKAIQCELLQPRAGTVGIWTDDCSMALCIAASLIHNKNKFMPKHMRYMFMLWILNGFNNGGRHHSIGLGGNIKISMDEFMKNPTDYCQRGDRFNNGNGSLMRLAPMAIAYRKDINQAVYLSGCSSLTTHNGEQAEECCKLLTHILIRLYRRKEHEQPKQVLEQACNSFISECTSVQLLSKSKEESVQVYNSACKKYGKKFVIHNRSIDDRNWNWKSEHFDYSPTRTEDKPGYVGSYCMDALAMALHTVWKTKTFKEVAIVNANLGGDCDTVGAIAGQIAGAMYGIDKEMLKLYSQMIDFRASRYQLFLHALKLTEL